MNVTDEGYSLNCLISMIMLTSMSPAVRHFLRQPWLRELLLVALLFKALIPAGYMADVGQNGLPSLKLCSFALALTGQSTPGDDAPSPGPDNSQGDHAIHEQCPQALSLQPALASAWVMTWTNAASAPRLSGIEVGSPFTYLSPTPHSRLPRGPPALA